MSDTKPTPWLAEAARAYYIEHCHNGKDFPNFPVEKSLTMRAFIAGHDAAMSSPVIRAMAEALAFYAHGKHFEFGGREENAPETVSGEPLNYECGGDDGHEYTYENGGIARKALAQFAAMGGE